MAANWSATKREILDRLDIAAEYRSLGVDVTGDSPNANGWLKCRTFGADDRNPSAGVNVGDDNRRGRYHEFTGTGRDLSFFDFAVVTGKFADWKEAVKYYAKQTGAKLPRGKAAELPEDKLAFVDFNEALVLSWTQKKPGITVPAVRAAGGRLADWPAKSKSHTTIALPVFGPHGLEEDPCGWVIYNQTGRDLPLFQGKGTPPKSAKILTVGGSKSGWIGKWGLRHLADADVVWVSEGVSDALAVQSAIPANLVRSHVVITNSGGTMEFPRPEMVAMLAGKTVFVIHDADKPGQLGAERWARAIATVAAECRNVLLPYAVEENHGRDVRDWLVDGYTYADLLDLAAACPVVSEAVDGKSCPPGAQAPPPPGSNGHAANPADPLDLNIDRHICEAIDLDVLGETGDGQVLVFSTSLKKTASIRDIARLKYANLLQIGGPVVKKFVHEAADGTEIAGMYHLDQVRKSIAVLGGQRRIHGGTTKGAGCWLGTRGEVVLVGAGEAAVWDGATLERVCRPRAGGLILDISESTPWFDYDSLKTLLESRDQSWMGGTVDEAVALFEKWHWKQDRDTSDGGVIPSLVTGLILSTWVQSIWDWRPLVSITGESSSGKSTLFDMIGMMFGRLAQQSSISTEAGLRQAIKNRSPAILIDEFEHNKHRRQLLELMRTSGRGAKLLRGTVNQEGVEFGLRHICWVAGIESGLESQPDRNRFICLELAMPPVEKRGDIDFPNSADLEDLGQRLLAIAVYHARAARVLADRLKRQKFSDTHSRIVESFATPAAMLALVAGRGDETGSRAVLENILNGIERDPGQGTSDQEDLMHATVGSILRIDNATTETVSVLLTQPNRHLEGTAALEKSGMKTCRGRCGPRGQTEVDRRPGDVLFIVPGMVKRYILKETKWADLQIDELFLRFDGAKRGQRKMSGRIVRGIEIPWETMERFFNDGDQEEDADEDPGEF